MNNENVMQALRDAYAEGWTEGRKDKSKFTSLNNERESRALDYTNSDTRVLVDEINDGLTL